MNNAVVDPEGFPWFLTPLSDASACVIINEV